MLQLGFYEVLGTTITASVRTLTICWRAKALLYHPDRVGVGTSVEFRFVKMVYDVLRNVTTRAEHDSCPTGGARWTSEFMQGEGPVGPDVQPTSRTVPAPPVNVDFLKSLLGTRTASDHFIGTFPMRIYIESILDNTRAEDVYSECKVAIKLGLQLRLVAKGDRSKLPVLPQPRILRYAAFMGVDVIELDVPSSHGQQALKYCRKHNLRCDTLAMAFASTNHVRDFRTSLNISPDAAKLASNLLVGGAGVKKIMLKCNLASLPPTLLRMRDELAEMRRHMLVNCPPSWRLVLRSAKYDHLTLGSWHYQLGERVDLELVTARLQAIGVTCHGWLGDSILTSAFPAEEFCRGLEQEGLFITMRRFPRTPQQYFASFEAITATTFDLSKLTDRQVRQALAYTRAARWLREMEDKADKADKMPHTEFAIAIQAALPTKRSVAGKTEVYVPEHGVWTCSVGVSVSVEAISDALQSTFSSRQWQFVDVGAGEFKMRLVAGVINMFFTAPVLNTIADMSKKLALDTDVEPLDMYPGVEKLKNFRGPMCLDFSTVPPEVDWQNDLELAAALNLPVRHSVITDRTTRSVPRVFEEYEGKGKLDLARAIQGAMVELSKADLKEESYELSTEARNALELASEGHNMIRKIFFQAHNDWDSAMMQLRLVFEPLQAKSNLCQTVSFLDEGSGSTAKGTVRALIEACLGAYAGEKQLGYCSTLTVESLAQKKCEGPTEQKANLFLCSHAFIDDFSPWEPLNNVALRQFSGGNSITAARKGMPEIVFRFVGQVYLLCNDAWTPKEKFIGADIRRHHGLMFNVKFVDEADGPNEVKKDNEIKTNIGSCFSEFWFVARVLWLATKAHPQSDHTLPFCTNSVGVVRALLDKNGGGEMPSASVDPLPLKAAIAKMLTPYIPSDTMPASASTIDKILCRAVSYGDGNEHIVRTALRKLFVYKNHNVAAFGQRKRTSINAYVNEAGSIMTLV
jgi:hypothetical protein